MSKNKQRRELADNGAYNTASGSGCKICAQQCSDARALKSQYLAQLGPIDWEADHIPMSCRGMRRKRDEEADDTAAAAELRANRELQLMTMLQTALGAKIASLANETPKTWGDFRGPRVERHLETVHTITTLAELHANPDYIAYERNTKRARDPRSSSSSSSAAAVWAQPALAFTQHGVVPPSIAAIGDPTAFLATAFTAFTARETNIISLVRTHQPLSVIADPFHKRTIELADWHRTTKPLTSREAATEAAVVLAARMQREVMSALFDGAAQPREAHRRGVMTTASLAADAGTVWDRYRALVLHGHSGPVNSRALLYSLKPDFEIDGAYKEALAKAQAALDDTDLDAAPLPEELAMPHLTAEHMQAHVRATIDELATQHRIFVLAICTDNASNMTSMIAKLGIFDARCGCHGIQLIARALMADKEGIPEIYDALVAARKFVDAVKKLPTAQIAVQLLSSCAHIGPETRWDSELQMIECVLAAHDRRLYQSFGSAAPRTGSATGRAPKADTVVEPASGESLKNMRTAIAVLMPFRVATKIVERDDATQLDLVRAIGILDLGDHVDYPHLDWTGVNKCVQARIVCAPLVVTAFFCRTVEVTFAKLEVIIAFIKSVILCAHSKMLCERVLGVDALAVARQFGTYVVAMSSTFSPKRAAAAQYETSVAEFDDNLARMRESDCAALAAWVREISRITASEASCERVFRDQKLTVGKTQKQLLASNVEARLKIGSLSKFYLDARKAQHERAAADAAAAAAPQPVEQDRAAPIVVHGEALTQEARDAMRRERVAMFSGATYLLNRAVDRISAEKKNVAALHANKCPGCGKTLPGAHRANQPTITCIHCELDFPEECSGTMRAVLIAAGALTTWKCKTCDATPAPPLFW